MERNRKSLLSGQNMLPYPVKLKTEFSISTSTNISLGNNSLNITTSAVRSYIKF